ncbi:MAG: MMPL family transporter, partial [Pseudomonadota bacterium]
GDQFLVSDNNAYILSLSLLNESDSWESKENLDLLASFSEKFFENENILDIVHLGNVSTAITEKDQFQVGSLRELASLPDIQTNPLLTPHLLSRNGRHAALVIRPELLSATQHIALLREIEQSVQAFQGVAKVQIGGPAAITTQMTELLSSEILLFTLLALALSLFIFVLAFRGFVAPMICILTVLMANICGMGVMGILGIPLTVLSNTLPILMTICVVAIISHTLIHLDEKLKESQQGQAFWVPKVLKELAGPHLLTAVTTAIGFGTLIPSDVPIISQYGLSVAAGVMIACLMSLLVLPLFLHYFKAPVKRQWKISSDFFVTALFKHKKGLFAVITTVAVFLAWNGKDLNWSSQILNDLPASHPARKATEFADQHFGGTLPLHLVIHHDQENYWKKADSIKALAALTQELRGTKDVASIVSLADFMEMAHPDKVTPKNDKALSEMYLVYGMSEENPIESFITPNGQKTRLSLRMRDLPSVQMMGILEILKEKTKTVFPNAKIDVSGTAITAHQVNHELAKTLIYGFFTALFWIVLLLAFVYRSLTWALVSVIPNLMPPLFLLGVLALTETPIKPGIAIIFAISLGIAFDNTVYILGRLKKMALNEDGSLPIKSLLLSEIAPCCTSSLSLFAGFSIFLYSYFAVNQLFGVFMLLSIVSGLLGDLVLLPITLSLFPGLLSLKFERVIMDTLVRIKMTLFSNYKSVSTGLLLIFSLLFVGQSVDAKTSSEADQLIKKV